MDPRTGCLEVLVIDSPRYKALIASAENVVAAPDAGFRDHCTCLQCLPSAVVAPHDPAASVSVMPAGMSAVAAAATSIGDGVAMDCDVDAEPVADESRSGKRRAGGDIPPVSRYDRYDFMQIFGNVRP